MKPEIWKMRKNTRKLGRIATRLLLLVLGMTAVGPMSACRKPTYTPPPLNRTNLCPTTNGNTNCSVVPGSGVALSAIAGGAGAGAAALGSLSNAQALVGRNGQANSTAAGEFASSQYATAPGNAGEGSKAPQTGAVVADAPVLQENALASRGDRNRGLASGGAGGGAGGGLLGSSGSSRTEASAPISGPSDSEIQGLRDDSSAAMAAQGAGGAGGGDSEGGGINHALAGLFGGGGEGSGFNESAAVNSIGFLSTSGEIPPMGTPDPNDYFARFNPKLSLFEVVSNRYRRTQQRWPLEDANRALSDFRKQPLRAPASARK
jgi:hypothetical protein